MVEGRMPVNEKEEIEQNLEAYKKNSGRNEILHFLQKDAIQNSIDAMSKKEKFKVTFELTKVRGKNGSYDYLLIITDSGTTGMTGKGIPKEIEDDEHEVEKYLRNPDEKWGRFESKYFAKEGEGYKDLGSKGRGKLIFLGASVDNEIYFDSLRQDGTYKFGGLSANGNKRYFYEEGEESLQEFKQKFPKLEPLEEVGTRIIIVNVKAEIIDDFKNLEKYVQETWWEALQDGLKFYYKNTAEGDDEWKQISPNPITDFDKIIPSKKLVKENGKFPYSKEKDYGYRKLVIAISDTPLPDEYAGIYIQRGYMKIESFISDELKPLSRDQKNKIYGFIKLDERTEKEFRDKVEDITHYGYKGNTVLGKILKNFLEEEVGKFARERGILSPPSSNRDETLNKVRIVVSNKLNKFLNNFGFSGSAHNIKEKNEEIEYNEPDSPVSIQLVGLKKGLIYKRGEKLEFKVKIINRELESNKSYLLRLTLYKDTIAEENEVKVLYDKTFEKMPEVQIVPTNSMISYTFQKRISAKGHYIIEKLLCDKEGKKIYTRIENIWVEEEPPVHGGLIDIDYSDTLGDLLYEIIPEGDRYKIYISTTNNFYKQTKDDEGKLTIYSSLIASLAVIKILRTRGDLEELLKVLHSDVKSEDEDLFGPKILGLVLDNIGKM